MGGGTDGETEERRGQFRRGAAIVHSVSCDCARRVLKCGISPPAVRMIQREQQFVEKLHAYTLPRAAAPNSRVRDLVDMALLVQSGTLEPKRVLQALHATFDLRATHAVPKALDPPPEEWNAPFERLAKECRLELSAFRTIPLGKWRPVDPRSARQISQCLSVITASFPVEVDASDASKAASRTPVLRCFVPPLPDTTTTQG
jgi:hypothetical protein